MPLSKKLQEIVDLITHNRDSMLQSISGLSDAQLNYKTEGDAWSICDIVHHLALTDEANAKLMSNLLKRAAGPVGNGGEFIVQQSTRAKHIPLDHVLWHGFSFP